MISLSDFGGSPITISNKYVSAQIRALDREFEQDLFISKAVSQPLVLGSPALVSAGVRMTTAEKREILSDLQGVFLGYPLCFLNNF